MTPTRLLFLAKKASESSYSPYSKFRVGAAVLTDSGKVYAACNVENASYGLTICAERSAVFQMVAKAKERIVAVAIWTPTDTATAPCGACRQVVNEFGPAARIISGCKSNHRLDAPLDELLPHAFGPENPA